MSTPSWPVSLCCLDLAGTTVLDGGLVEAAFRSALDQVGVPTGSPDRERMEAYVASTMGTSKIVVFRALFCEAGLAEEANAAFEAAYAARIAGGGAQPVPGAEWAIAALRAGGVKVALHTGFSAATRDHLLEALGWIGLADLVLCPSEAGRGRPYPDMILASVLRLGVDDVTQVAVAGDTAADMVAGRRAGSVVVAGVLTGADGRDRLIEAGATHVLGSVAELPPLLGLG